MADRPKALIIGAGIGGLAAGVALRQAGWHVQIHERASEPRELGFAGGLAPTAIAALGELGVAEAIVTLRITLPGDCRRHGIERGAV